ncbi:hypothetical protein [Paraburkholderia caribensis]|uniref:hypothetical protein n=1 Tax=Paraburkholderia caribensis TaxID=75105 RepID=UPI00078D6C1C|nr:hypothetical protein [Paraburkholderia caribensis]AMV48523.1 hypothetical protein ATN79_48650 [Paraburkholderia caribensis]
MDIDLIVKPVTVLFGAYGAAKVYYELSLGKVTRMREQYRFAKEYFADIKSGEANHPFLREKGLQAIIGDERLHANDIKYLLRLKEPAKAIEYFALGKRYLQLRRSGEDEAIEFRRPYRGEWSRRWRKQTFLGLYGISAFVGYGPIAFSKYLFSSQQSLLTACALTIPVGSYYAWMALKAAVRINRAESLVKSQELADVGPVYVVSDVTPAAQELESELGF